MIIDLNYSYNMEIKGHVTDFRKSVHVPDFKAYRSMSRNNIFMFMNNSGQLILSIGGI